MKKFKFSGFMLVAGLVFIYLPMLILVIYSFNASRLVTVWGGWSTKWYAGLLDNTQLMNAVMRSLEIATYTAIAATALGTLAALVLTRIGRFRGRTLFGGAQTNCAAAAYAGAILLCRGRRAEASTLLSCLFCAPRPFCAPACFRATRAQGVP